MGIKSDFVNDFNLNYTYLSTNAQLCTLQLTYSQKC